MKRRTIWVSGALLAGAALAFAMQSASSLIGGHAAAMNKAEGASARLIAIAAGSGRVQTTIDVAKPNLLRIESPTSLIVSDGKEIVSYFKGQNIFTRKPVSNQALAAALGPDMFLAFRPFFDANALSGMTSTRTAAAVNRRGQELTPVSGNIGAGKRATLFIGADGLARQLELATTADGRTETIIVDMADFAIGRPSADKFTFRAPAGAREVDEAELNAGRWFRNLEEAKAEAKRTGKPIMMDLYTDWCGFCKKLDAEVFQTSEFMAKGRQFVLLKINPEKDEGGTQGFNVEGFPTVIFMSPDGSEIHRVVGFRPLDMFLQEMDKAINR